MKNKKLFEEYVKYFGNEPPYPPEHIMETLVNMKKEGTYDKMMEIAKPLAEELMGKIEDLTGEPLSADHPFFDIDLEEEEAPKSKKTKTKKKPVKKTTKNKKVSKTQKKKTSSKK